MKKLYLLNLLIVFILALSLFFLFVANYDDDESFPDIICDNKFIFRYHDLLVDISSRKLISYQKVYDISSLQQIILYIEKQEKSPPAFCS